MCSFSWIYSTHPNPVLRTAQAEILAMPAMEEREKLESFWFKFQLFGWWRTMGIHGGPKFLKQKWSEIPMTSHDPWPSGCIEVPGEMLVIKLLHMGPFSILLGSRFVQHCRIWHDMAWWKIVWLEPMANRDFHVRLYILGDCQKQWLMASLPLTATRPGCWKQTARLGVGCGVEVGEDEDRFPVRFRCRWDWSAACDTIGAGNEFLYCQSLRAIPCAFSCCLWLLVLQQVSLATWVNWVNRMMNLKAWQTAEIIPPDSPVSVGQKSLENGGPREAKLPGAEVCCWFSSSYHQSIAHCWALRV